MAPVYEERYFGSWTICSNYICYKDKPVFYRIDDGCNPAVDEAQINFTNCENRDTTQVAHIIMDRDNHIIRFYYHDENGELHRDYTDGPATYSIDHFGYWMHEWYTHGQKIFEEGDDDKYGKHLQNYENRMSDEEIQNLGGVTLPEAEWETN